MTSQEIPLEDTSPLGGFRDCRGESIDPYTLIESTFRVGALMNVVVDAGGSLGRPG